MTPPGPLTTRAATPVDDAFLRDLYASVRAPELAAVPWSDAEKRAFCDMQFTLQDRHYREHFPHAHRHVVLEAASAVGRIYVDPAGDEIRILDIALVPAARGRGIGTRLLRNILDEADRTRRRVSLVTEPGNPARRLYARLGFIDRDAGPLHVEMVRSPA